jgi:hypothetical protein
MTTPPSHAPAPKGAAACPICRRPIAARFRPFCSARCAEVDLGRWFNESYRVPIDDPVEEPDDRKGRGGDLPG